jgi:hypothetical protein
VSQLTRDRIAVPHSPSHKRPGIRPRPSTQRRSTMFKTLIATLILATASVALTSKVNAGPTDKYPTHAEQNYMDRASKIWDGGAQ